MHEELEQILKNKHVTLPVHRGELPMSEPISNPAPSFLKQLFNASVPGTIAFSFVFFTAAALVSLTWQLPAEQDIEIAITEPFVVAASAQPGTRVLGTTAAKGITADITVNGRNADTVTPGSQVRLAWTSSGATNCVVDPIDEAGVSGEGLTGELKQSQTFTLACEGNGKVATDTAFVEVTDEPTIRRR